MPSCCMEGCFPPFTALFENKCETMGTSIGISQTKQIRMPKLQEHHSKGSQWCKINIDLFNFF